MTSSAVARYVAEVEHAKAECLNLLAEIRNYHPLKGGAAYPGTYRLIVTPMLYSAWERCFTLCHAVALRLIRELASDPQSLGISTRAIWLMHTGFYRGFVSKLQSHGPEEDRKRLRRGHFPALCEFLTDLDTWSTETLDPNIDTDELVMTFSNVNQNVVRLNAAAIGISEFPAFKALNLGRLDDLVGQRNDIGHGAIIQPPGEKHFIELWQFTEELIAGYCNAFVGWMQSNVQRGAGSVG